MSQKKLLLPVFLLFAFLVATDQISKYIIRVLGGFYICNPNVAFGLSSGLIFYLTALILVSLLILNFKFITLNLKLISNFLSRRQADKFQIPKLSLLAQLSIILILSGAFSNILDRLYFGCIIDFINLQIWPVFNFADLYITIGATILIFMTLFKRKH